MNTKKKQSFTTKRHELREKKKVFKCSIEFIVVISRHFPYDQQVIGSRFHLFLQLWSTSTLVALDVAVQELVEVGILGSHVPAVPQVFLVA